MRFARIRTARWISPVVASLLASLVLPSATLAVDKGHAVVPTQVIYPGDEIIRSQLDVVAVTNPNIAGGYASSLSEVEGKISKRTLLPGRTIPVSALRDPFAVRRGASLRLTFTVGNMLISASGTSLADGIVGDLIKVRNIDSGIVVSGTIMADGTVQVMAK